MCRLTRVEPGVIGIHLDGQAILDLVGAVLMLTKDKMLHSRDIVSKYDNMLSLVLFVLIEIW